jgi:hypothetical protein
MEALISILLQKCGISYKFNMHAFCNPVSHISGSITTILVFALMYLFRYLLDAISINLFSSVMAWSIYFKLGIKPNMSSSTITPTGIFGSTSLYLASFNKFTGFVVSFHGSMKSLGKGDELGSDIDALGVSTYTSIVGGLLRCFFGAEVDATTSLGGAIVLQLLSVTNVFGFVHLSLVSTFSVFFVLSRNTNNNNFY